MRKGNCVRQIIIFAVAIFIQSDAWGAGYRSQAAHSCQKMLNITANTWYTAERQWRIGYAGCRSNIACWQHVEGQMRQDADIIQSQKNLLTDSGVYGVIAWRQGHYFMNTQQSALRFFRYALAGCKAEGNNRLQGHSPLLKDLLQHVHGWRLQTNADISNLECRG